MPRLIESEIVINQLNLTIVELRKEIEILENKKIKLSKENEKSNKDLENVKKQIECKYNIYLEKMDNLIQTEILMKKKKKCYWNNSCLFIFIGLIVAIICLTYLFGNENFLRSFF